MAVTTPRRTGGWGDAFGQNDPRRARPWRGSVGGALSLEVLMRAPLTHGAATAWLVAFVATLTPATALAQAVDPAAPPGNGAQQQPADPPPAPCAVPGTPRRAPAATTAPGPGPAAQPPVRTGTVPLGPTGPVVDAGVKPAVVETAPA